MIPTVTPVPRNFDLLNVARPLNVIVLEGCPESRGESFSSTHRRLAGNQEHDILSHQSQYLWEVPGGSGPQPLRNQFSNLLLVIIHKQFSVRSSAGQALSSSSIIP